MILVLMLACKAPIDAPRDFDTLTSYLYEHMMGDGGELEAGMVNIDDWMKKHHSQVEVGYSLSNLSRAAIQTVHPDYTAKEDLFGVALSMDYDQSIDVLASYYYYEDPDEDPDPDLVYLEDNACFLAHECETASYREKVDLDLPLGIHVESVLKSEARWVELEQGTALIQRRWLVRPAEVSVDWVALEQEFALQVTLPVPGGIRRMETSWVLVTLGELPVPEALILSLGIKELEKSLESLIGKLEDEAENLP